MNKSARMFKALSEEVRLRILALLTGGELCVCDLMAVLDIPQSTISRHLAYLRNAGWVEGERHGIWMHYRLTTSVNIMQRELARLLAERLAALPEATRDREALMAYLATKKEAACA